MSNTRGAAPVTRPGGQRAPETEADPRRWRVLVVLAAVAFMAQLDVFIINVAVPSIRGSFHGSSLSAI